MNAACRAKDQQQLQVRHFRSVLYGAATALFVSAVVLWIVGSIHPAYFPLCWPVSGSHPATMICPTGGSAPGQRGAERGVPGDTAGQVILRVAAEKPPGKTG